MLTTQSPSAVKLLVSLEDKLRHQLGAARVVVLVRGGDLTKTCSARVHCRSREQWMVQRVDEFNSELQFHLFPQVHILTQTDVHVVDGVDADVAESQRQRAQVIHRSSTVCTSPYDPSASRIPTGSRNKRRRVEPPAQGLLVLIESNLASQIERIICESDGEA